MKPRVFIKENLVKPEAKKNHETFWIQFMEMKKWLSRSLERHTLTVFERAD